jgi:hypothetical protein
MPIEVRNVIAAVPLPDASIGNVSASPGSRGMDAPARHR